MCGSDDGVTTQEELTKLPSLQCRQIHRDCKVKTGGRENSSISYVWQLDQQLIWKMEIGILPHKTNT